MKRIEALSFALQVDEASFVEVIQFGEQDFGVFVARAHGRPTGKHMVNGFLYMRPTKPYSANVKVVEPFEVDSTYRELLNELKQEMGRLIGGKSNVR